ncbi:MAG: hypothetical protein HYY26_02485 [Acidobacteria bacterium]|nr:hypothetical protein [Acidobacteriota bacterium]
MAVGVRLCLLVLAGGLVAGVAAAEKLEELQEKLSRTSSPAERAKITVKIGEELLKQAAAKYGAGAYEEGDRVLAEYVEAIRAAHQGLQDSGRDARRKPAGFKQLEIHLRKSRRKLEDMARIVPYPQRAPVEKTMEEMESIRSELLRALMRLDPKPESNI